MVYYPYKYELIYTNNYFNNNCSNAPFYENTSKITNNCDGSDFLEICCNDNINKIHLDKSLDKCYYLFNDTYLKITCSYKIIYNHNKIAQMIIGMILIMMCIIIISISVIKNVKKNNKLISLNTQSEKTSLI